MKDLLQKRAEIDKIDDCILLLLRRRAEKCLGIKEIKSENGLSTLDRAREEKVLKKCKTPYEFAVYQRIILESRKLQR